MGRKLLHLLNGTITFVVVLALAVAGAYAGYALWDNQQIYDAAENVFSEVKEMRASLGMPGTLSAMEELLEENWKAREEKAAEAARTAAPETSSNTETLPDNEISTVTEVPAVAVTPVTDEVPAVPEESVPAATPAPTEEPISPLLAQLKTINPDITAWITLPDTAIDYPVMQGSSNYSYINTDVYGNFALAGSIFLDYRNSDDYLDLYSLLYGHNMSKNRMFSDINLYKEEDFFKDNTLGIMLTKDGWHILESLSVIVVPASDSSLFNPENWNYLDGEGIYKLAQENALFTCEKGLQALREQIDAGETPRLVSLSTCSNEFTDARTILLTLMDP